jgi:hypothetical protein
MASCADLVLDDEPPVALVATARLPLAETDWPRFHRLLAQAAAHHGWTWRDCPQTNALGGSLRRPDGTQVSYKQWAWANPPERCLTLYVVAPIASQGWRAPVEALLGRLQRAWPN